MDSDVAHVCVEGVWEGWGRLGRAPGRCFDVRLRIYGFTDLTPSLPSGWPTCSHAPANQLFAGTAAGPHAISTRTAHTTTTSSIHRVPKTVGRIPGSTLPSAIATGWGVYKSTSAQCTRRVNTAKKSARGVGPQCSRPLEGAGACS